MNRRADHEQEHEYCLNWNIDLLFRSSTQCPCLGGIRRALGCLHHVSDFSYLVECEVGAFENTKGCAFYVPLKQPFHFVRTSLNVRPPGKVSLLLFILYVRLIPSAERIYATKCWLYISSNRRSHNPSEAAIYIFPHLVNRYRNVCSIVSMTMPVNCVLFGAYPSRLFELHGGL